MHKFIAEEKIEELLPDHIRTRITPEKLAHVYSTYCNSGLWYPDQIRELIQELMKSGHYTQMPDTHAAVMEKMEEEPKTFNWKIGDGTKEAIHTEEVMPNDILLVSGAVASEVLTPDEFWDTLPGFSGPSDMHGTIGTLLMRNRDIFSHYNCYTWESEHDSKKYRTRVSGDNNLDLRVERICMTTSPTIDPFGSSVHYQPITGREKNMLFASSNSETNLLAAILKYVHQEKIDVPCLADEGKTLIEEMKQGTHAGQAQHMDVGHALSSFVYPIGDVNDRTSIFWNLPKEHHGNYRIHLGDKRHLAFTNTRGGKPDSDISMTIPPEEIDQLIRAIFMQSKKHRGRTSLGTLEAMMQKRFSQDFTDQVTNEKKRVFGEE